MFKLHPWQIEAVRRLHEEVNYFENESMMDECDIKGGLADSEHEHDMFETTTVCSTERTYVCLICGYTETEPMFLTIPSMKED